MIEPIYMQTVLVTIMSGIALVCLAFMLYWRLLGEKYMQRQRVPAEVRIANRNRAAYRRPVSRYAEVKF